MSRLNKYGWIKEMELEEYSNDMGDFSLELSQTPFGDLALIFKHDISPKGFERKSGYKSTYFEDSRNDSDILDNNVDKAKEWFYEIMNIR